MLLRIVFLAAWLYPMISAFQGREARLPVVADLADRFIKALVG
jgi:uncharacterized membrane protein